MLKVSVAHIILFVISIIQFTCQAEVHKHSGLIKVISNFFIQRRVHTVTAATCWPTGNYMIIKINYYSHLSETILLNKVYVKMVQFYLIDVNEELLKTFSTIDKSLSFCLFSPQTYNTWYRHGYIVDLSCDGTLSFLHKVFTHIYIFL